MLFLVLLQTVLLLSLAAVVLYWRLQTNRTLHRMTLLETERLSAIGSLQAAVAMLQSELSGIREREKLPESLPPRADPQPQQPAQALSLQKRSQALKMIRRGDSVERIAAAVSAPQSQIRLLQKVCGLIDAGS